MHTFIIPLIVPLLYFLISKRIIGETAYQCKEVRMAIFEAGAIRLNVSVVGHPQICVCFVVGYYGEPSEGIE